MIVKIALLGTGFGQAHAAVYAQRPDMDEVIVFSRTPEKLTKISEQFGFATSTDLHALITDRSVDLVDICLPGAYRRRPARSCRTPVGDFLTTTAATLRPTHAHPVSLSRRLSGRTVMARTGGAAKPIELHKQPGDLPPGSARAEVDAGVAAVGPLGAGVHGSVCRLPVRVPGL
jgi:hypothetical protein